MRRMARWSPEYRFFLKRLIQARQDAGLSQRQAAARLGRLQSYVSKSELGERRVDAIELAEFAKLYRKDLYYFLPESLSARPGQSR
jgi:transcriptional regulator with XRE-family HTH domain